MGNSRGGDGADEADLAAFVADAWPSLVRTGFLLTGSRAAAEDLVQESLLRCLGPWRQSGPPAQAMAYVRTAMVRQALRWRKARRAYGTGQPSGPESIVSDGSAEHAQTDAVRRALRTLPMDQRAVLVLRFYDGFTVTEIAEALQIAPGTVKSRTSRALAALRSGGLLAPARPTDLEAPHG